MTGRTIHPFPSAYRIQGQKGLEHIPADKRQGTLWTGHQSVTGLTRKDRQPVTPPVNLDWTINPTFERNLEYPEEPTQTCVKHADSTKKDPRLNSNPGPSCLLTTTPPCYCRLDFLNKYVNDNVSWAGRIVHMWEYISELSWKSD